MKLCNPFKTHLRLAVPLVALAAVVTLHTLLRTNRGRLRQLLHFPRPEPAHVSSRTTHLSASAMYRANFVPAPPAHPPSPPHAPSTDLAELAARSARAAAARANASYRALLGGPSLALSRRFSVESVLEKDGYKHSDDLIDKYCPHSLVRIPASVPDANPLCLSVLQNAYFGTQGIVLHPASRTLYDSAGGCCHFDWRRFRKNVELPRNAKEQIDRYGGQVMLSLCFHHDATYHHVIHELISKYVLVAPLLDAAPHIQVAIDNSDIAETLLLTLGLSRSRLFRFPDYKRPHWRFAGVLLFPPPMFQHEYLRYYPKGIEKNVAAVFTGLALQKANRTGGPVDGFLGPRKPVMLLLERARVRDGGGDCSEQRCLKNFAAVHDGLRNKFENDYDLELYRAADNITTAINLFSRAAVIVGVHGAGFQNMMFCRPNTTVVHIGWGIEYKYLAEEFNLSYHLFLTPDLERNTANYLLKDVDELVRNVSIAIKKDEGLVLPPG